jgi:protease IV
MSLMATSDIDHYINHLSLKKSLKRWRWIAVALGIIALIALFAQGGGNATRGDHIARLRVDGLITGNDVQLGLIKDIAEDETAKALIVRIDSPGGTTSGSEAIYEALRDVSAKKPVVAVMDSIAASGGYITALGADRIYARQNTITGSIGVIFQYPDVSQLLSNIGVKMEEIKSADLKAEPSMFKPTSDNAREAARVLVLDGFDWFKGLVAERRKLDAGRVAILADGRVYSGRQAVREGLIDALGAEEEAQAWLESDKSIAKDLKIEDWLPPKPWFEETFGASATDMTLNAIGFPGLAQANTRARLDGLLVLWHP